MVLARDGADTANAAARTAGAKLILERMMSLLSQLPSLQVRQTLGSTAFRKSMTSMASNDRQFSAPRRGAELPHFLDQRALALPITARTAAIYRRHSCLQIMKHPCGNRDRGRREPASYGNLSPVLKTKEAVPIGRGNLSGRDRPVG